MPSCFKKQQRSPILWNNWHLSLLSVSLITRRQAQGPENLSIRCLVRHSSVIELMTLVGNPFQSRLVNSILSWYCLSLLQLFKSYELFTIKVSHHPPMLAMHVEGKNWTSWNEFSISSKFRGKYLQVVPLDISHLKFDDGTHFTWRKVSTTVHNIIVGKLWIDNHGDQIITNHTTGDKCHLKFSPYSYLSRESHRKVSLSFSQSSL